MIQLCQFGQLPMWFCILNLALYTDQLFVMKVPENPHCSDHELNNASQVSLETKVITTLKNMKRNWRLIPTSLQSFGITGAEAQWNTKQNAVMAHMKLQ